MDCRCKYGNVVSYRPKGKHPRMASPRPQSISDLPMLPIVRMFDFGVFSSQYLAWV